jgi:hypothetical protein
MGARKKLIFFGWNWPQPEFVRQNIGQMEQRPFDGTTIQLSAATNPLTRKPYPTAGFDRDAKALVATKFKKFSDNFLFMASGIEDGWRWDSDSDWAAAEANLKQFARVARAGRCKGFFFDTEPYGLSNSSWNMGPWRFRKSIYGDASYTEVAALVRRRGEQFLKALQSELPDLILVCTWLMEYLYREVENEKKSPAENLESAYNLLPPFLEGMLKAARGKTRIIDGNEIGYVYSSAAEYAATRRRIRDSRTLLEPPYRSLYDRRVGIAQSGFVDALMNLSKSTYYIGFFLKDKALQEKTLESSVYHMLQTTDEYAWLYSEQMDWWKGRIPEGVEEAVRRGREKAQTGQPLGLNLDAALKQARYDYDHRVYVVGKVVTPGGEGFPNVVFDCGPEFCATIPYDTEGHYSLAFPPKWGGTITVRPKEGVKVKIEPAFREYKPLADDATDQNYIVTPL